MSEPTIKTLTTGTNDILAQLGIIASEGVAECVSISIKNLSANALTGLVLNSKDDDQFAWTPYLSGTDWVSSSNPLLRTISSTSDASTPATLAAGQTAKMIVLVQGVLQLQLTASGTAGSQLLVQVRPIFQTNKR
jgi:hypothetical protein